MARNGKRLGFLPGWRIFSYVIVIFNIVMLILLITAISSATKHPTDCGSLDAKTCQDATDTGAAIGSGLVITLWAVIDVILGVLWLVTNRKKRDCPVCGHSVKKGAVQCRSCGHDFRQQYAQPQYAQPQYAQPQYAQPQYAQAQYAQAQYAQPQYAQLQPQMPSAPTSASKYYTPPRQTHEEAPASVAPEPRRRPGPGPRP